MTRIRFLDRVRIQIFPDQWENCLILPEYSMFNFSVELLKVSVRYTAKRSKSNLSCPFPIGRGEFRQTGPDQTWSAVLLFWPSGSVLIFTYPDPDSPLCSDPEQMWRITNSVNLQKCKETTSLFQDLKTRVVFRSGSVQSGDAGRQIRTVPIFYGSVTLD
jgi:hypothetical protein